MIVTALIWGAIGTIAIGLFVGLTVCLGLYWYDK